jgi:hypothetical protein
MKTTKAADHQDAAAFVVLADVGKWSNPSPLQGGAHQLRGFKSRHRFQFKAPVEAATSSGAEITAAKAAMTCKPIIGILAVDLKEIQSDHQCSKTFLAPQDKPLEGMYLPVAKAEMVLKLLLEGNSVSSVERITDIHHGTILKLLVLAGEKCERIMGEKIRNVKVRDVEADEVWSFIGRRKSAFAPMTIRT